MKRNMLWAAVVFVCAGGLAFAQDPAPTREDFSPASTPEEGRMTWDDLREEHKTFMEGQQEENKAWREDFRDRWHQAIEQCKAGGVNPGACHQQYLKDLRQEAKAYHQQQKQERQQHHQDMVDSRQEHIQEWKESHPGVNPPGPVGGPGAGPNVKDRLEDVRDRVSPAVPQKVIRDAARHPEAAKKAYHADQKNPAAARKAVQDGGEHPRSVQKAAQHPQRAKPAVK